jgi:FAD binding domain/Berberine and berberine like
VTERVSRRTALALGGLAVAALASACTAGSRPKAGATGASTTPPPGPQGTSPTSGPSAADWSAFAASIDGTVRRPGAAGFGAAHALYDPRWDSVVPAGVVGVAGAADVAEALRFATRFGLRVVPRGGGHSYLGASVVPGGLVIDTRSLHTVSYDPASATATIGAGAPLSTVYSALAGHGRGVPGGTCPTVGMAGLAQGGGFGIFDRLHGLTCDAVVELQVVTAAGDVVTVDAAREPDLFWALRGGGGGTFAVVTSLRLRTFAAHDIGRWYVRWPWSRAATVIAAWQQFMGSASAAVWANAHLDVLADGTKQVVVVGFSFNGRSPAADRDALVRRVGVEPLSASSRVASHLATVSLAGSITHESFVAGSSVPASPVSAASIARVVSSTAGGSLWSGERHAVLDPLGGAVSRVRASATAFPWRSSPFTVQWYAKLPLSHPASDVAAARSWVSAARRAVASDLPGAYVNYPSADVTNVSAYFGPNTARLRTVKASADPSDLLRAPTAVQR